MKTINISTDFSQSPGARLETEGAYSGTKFREDILYPAMVDAIKNKEKFQVVLDGTNGLGTSFLEESFGGLIRANQVKYQDIQEYMILYAVEDPDYIDEIQEYLLEAHENESR